MILFYCRLTHAFTISTELIFKHRKLFLDSWIMNSRPLLYSSNFTFRIFSISLTGKSSSFVLYFDALRSFELLSLSLSLLLSLSSCPRRFLFFDFVLDFDFDEECACFSSCSGGCAARGRAFRCRRLCCLWGYNTGRRQTQLMLFCGPRGSRRILQAQRRGRGTGGFLFAGWRQRPPGCWSGWNSRRWRWVGCGEAVLKIAPPCPSPCWPLKPNLREGAEGNLSIGRLARTGPKKSPHHDRTIAGVEAFFISIDFIEKHGARQCSGSFWQSSVDSF